LNRKAILAKHQKEVDVFSVGWQLSNGRKSMNVLVDGGRWKI